MRPGTSPGNGALRLALGLTLLLGTSACVSLSTFQSPRVLEPGSGEVGAGALVTGGDAGAGELALIGRYGIAEGMDVGAKMWGWPPYLGLFGDVRYQLREGPFLLTGSMGASFFNIRESQPDEDVGTSAVALYPLLLAGSESLFAGVRWTQLFGTAGDLEASYGAGFSGLMAGAAFGSRIVVAPELNVHFGESVLVLPGVALRYRF